MRFVRRAGAGWAMVALLGACGGSGASVAEDGGSGDGARVVDGAGAGPDATDAALGARPTRENTGPRFDLVDVTPEEFMVTRSCDRQRITGDVRIEDASLKGQTFTFTDCEITGSVLVYLAGGGAQLPLEEMPILSMDHVDVLGSLQLVNAAKVTIDHSYVVGSQFTLNDVWEPFEDGPAPITVRNSVFYQFQGVPPDHTEALHCADYGQGYLFVNVAFVQQGPNNGTATATINFHGRDAVFDGCWFVWDGDPAAYYVVYIDGPGNVVRNSWFASGAGYVYPDSTTQATYVDNRNVDTGELIVLP